MRHLRFAVAVTGTLLLSGCAAQPAPTPTMSADQVSSLYDAIVWIDTLTADTPDLANEMTAGVAALKDAVEESPLLEQIPNDVVDQLDDIQTGITAVPENAADYIDDLRAVSGEISLLL